MAITCVSFLFSFTFSSVCRAICYVCARCDFFSSSRKIPVRESALMLTLNDMHCNALQEELQFGWLSALKYSVCSLQIWFYFGCTLLEENSRRKRKHVPKSPNERRLQNANGYYQQHPNERHTIFSPVGKHSNHEKNYSRQFIWIVAHGIYQTHNNVHKCPYRVSCYLSMGKVDQLKVERFSSFIRSFIIWAY